MQPTKVILLACGSFNPPTIMHLRIFELARDHLHRLGSHVVIGGLISPVHDAYGKRDLVSSTHRLSMIKHALQNSDWIKLSDWECNQETWTRTRQTLQYHQNKINSILNSSNDFNTDDSDYAWMPDSIRNGCNSPVQVKLLCGADLLESFAVPGLWSDEDIETIIKHHGLVVVTRENTNPLKFIYNSDALTRLMANITIVTEWITQDVSSTKIRRALRRSESVKYLLPDKVIDYIHKNALYGTRGIKLILYVMLNLDYSKYLSAPSLFLTPSPSDIIMDSPSPMHNPCFHVCSSDILSIPLLNTNLVINNRVDSLNKSNNINMVKHPGQAIKIITESSGEHKLLKDGKVETKQVCKKEDKMKIPAYNVENTTENSTKVVFSKYGIQVISDVETMKPSLLQNADLIKISNEINSRTVTKFSIRKGRRKAAKTVLKRFYRLHWGGWIRTIAGRHRRIWSKSYPRRVRVKQHVLCNATQCTLLDKMVGSYWRKPKYYVDDPYEPYHTREEFQFTYKKPRPYIPSE
ncbi:hypothetical protein FQR65_LT12208 [Abscondita terminalis]|nr:hypothetical protein FQR65_LT12208 [Abscondita terminalis]